LPENPAQPITQESSPSCVYIKTSTPLEIIPKYDIFVYTYFKLYTYLSYMKKTSAQQKAITLFKKQGGILKTNEALELGIHPKILYQLRDDGTLRLLDRGIYLLEDEEIDTAHIDLIITHKRLPKGIVCLLSALAFHGLTTHIPHAVYLAYQRGWREPKSSYPPIQIFRYSKASHQDGIEYYRINTVEIPIYSAAKTVVDCFKFRNAIGLETAIEALRDYWQQYKHSNVDDLLKHAKICRVEQVMAPYIDTIIHGGT
jgi:predicted transcriptional regulator of viral defense system